MFGLTSKVHLESKSELWKLILNMYLKIIFIILLFSKNLFASPNIAYNQKSCTVPFKETLLCSSFVQSCDSVSKQKLYQLMFSLAFNLQISVLFTYK